MRGMGHSTFSGGVGLFYSPEKVGVLGVPTEGLGGNTPIRSRQTCARQRLYSYSGKDSVAVIERRMGRSVVCWIWSETNYQTIRESWLAEEDRKRHSRALHMI